MSAPHEPFFLASPGLCAPIGLTTRANRLEAAAGTSRLFETGVLDSGGEAVRASILTLLEPEASRTDRVEALAVTALLECLEGCRDLIAERRVLFLALPQIGFGGPLDEDRLLHTLAEEASTRSLALDLETSRVERLGRAGFFAALERARVHLESSPHDLAIVGAADSWCDGASLSFLAGENRVLGAANSDGVLPGEGAGFLAVLPPVRAGQIAAATETVVLASTRTTEPVPFSSRKPSLSEGLAEAFRELRSRPVGGERRVDRLTSCQTGESFWGRELGNAYLRNADLMPEPFVVEYGAAYFGDAGAAAPALNFGLIASQDAGEEPWRELIYACSDDGEVGACVLERRRRE